MVSASGCGPEGRGFESHISPQKKKKAPHGSGDSQERTGFRNTGRKRESPAGQTLEAAERCFLSTKPPRTPRHFSITARSSGDRAQINPQTKPPNNFTPGCGAAGSARRLGACDRLMSRTMKARNISVFLAFSRFFAVFMFGKILLTTDLTTYGFERKIEYFHQSGCGAAGSARSLGLRCRRFESGHSDQKSRF